MFRRYSLKTEPSRQSWRRNSRVAVVSLLLHSLLVAGALRLHLPIRSPVPRVATPQPQVVYLDFPSLTSTVPTASVAQNHLRVAPLSEPLRTRSTRLPAPLQSAEENMAPGARSEGEVSTLPAPAAGARESLSRGWVRDPRLFLDPSALPVAPSGPVEQNLGARVRTRILADLDSVAAAKRRDAEQRQLTVAGRKVAVFGNFDEALANGFALGGMKIQPMDGRMWEVLEMKRQSDAFTRDSITRERIRATRERKNAERAGRQRQ